MYYFTCISFAIRPSGRKSAIKLIDWLKNYFRCEKNVRHLEVLLAVLISAILLFWACHSASGCRISSKSDHLQLWCYIDFQDGGRWGAISLPVSDWLTPSLQKINVYQQTKFRSYSSIYVAVITICGLEKQTSAILQFFFRLLLRPYHSNWRAIPHHATKFHSNRATRGAVMTSNTISRWRQRWLNTTSGFVCNDVSFIRRSKYQSATKFRRRILIRVWDMTTSGLEIGILFSLRFWTDRSNLRAILNRFQTSPNSGHPQRSNDVVCNFKMAAAVAQYYFRFRIQCRYTLLKFKV